MMWRGRGSRGTPRGGLGLILCKTREQITVEYALWNNATPIGIAEFRVTDALPADLLDSLPTVRQIEAELSRVPDDRAARAG